MSDLSPRFLRGLRVSTALSDVANLVLRKSTGTGRRDWAGAPGGRAGFEGWIMRPSPMVGRGILGFGRARRFR